MDGSASNAKVILRCYMNLCCSVQLSKCSAIYQAMFLVFFYVLAPRIKLGKKHIVSQNKMVHITKAMLQSDGNDNNM